MASALLTCFLAPPVLTCDAPRIMPEYAAISPTGPAPKTATDSPLWKPESTSPCQPVGKISASRAKSASCSTPGGSFNPLKSYQRDFICQPLAHARWYFPMHYLPHKALSNIALVRQRMVPWQRSHTHRLQIQGWHRYRRLSCLPRSCGSDRQRRWMEGRCDHPSSAT